jgi:heme-degrading monooxygenase HmoA
MIVRVWQAEATPENADAYARHLSEAVLPKLRGIAGYEGAYLLRRVKGDRLELVVLTLWSSMEAIRAFAGDEPERAVVEPAARAVLAAWDETVRHYDAALAVPPAR